jgi:5'-nucleotidase
MGQDLTYSGTVSAAFEAVIFRKPAVAFSLVDFSEQADYGPAAAIARRVIEAGWHAQLPPLTLLNVNIPPLPLNAIKGIKVVRQGLRTYNDELIARRDPRGVPYYWIGGDAPTGDITEEGTDMWAVHNGYVALTPIHLDMTNYALMDTMAGWDVESLRFS